MTRSIHTAIATKLAKLLVETRQEAGLTQVELAKKLRRPQSYVSKYEIGERRVDVVEFLEIAKALSADPADLIRRLTK